MDLCPIWSDELPDDGVSGTHFAFSLCNGYLVRQCVIECDTEVCRVVTVCKGVTIPCDVEVFCSISVP